MTHQRTPSRGGVTDVTLGNLAVAVSVAAMLVAGPRALGAHSFAGFAVAWTATTLFGYGLAMPTEQLITRRVSAGLADRTRVPTVRLVTLGVLTGVASWVWAWWSATASTYAHTAFAVVLGVVGWTLAAAARGHVAGTGHLRAYAWVFGVEAALRLALIAIALLFPPTASWMMACAVGLPILLAGVFGLLTARRVQQVALTPTAVTDLPGEQLSFVIVAVGYQVCLNGAPLVLDWRVGASTPSAVGAFVVASSYFRLASVLAGGFTTPALVSLSRSWAVNDLAQFGRGMWRAVRDVSIATSATSAIAVACAPFALPLLYGRDPHVSFGLALALAASTVAAAASAVAGTGLIAAGDAPRAALCWLLGAACMIGLVSIDTEIGLATGVGLVAGPGLALIALLWSVSHAMRGHHRVVRRN